MQPRRTAKPRLVGRVTCKIKEGGAEGAYRRIAGRFHLSVQFLLTPGGGC